MSMLSAQIDHLRELADALDGKYGYQGYEIAMRDAADTICELRGALQVASVDYRHLADENARLRELVADMLMCLTWQYEPHGYMEDGCNCCRFRGKTHGECGLGMFRGRSSELGVEVEL